MITFHDLALVACLWWSCVYSFEALEDCRKTVNLTSVNNNIIYVSNGTAVCFECDYSRSTLVSEIVFRINGENVTSSSTMARVVKNETHFIDTLVVLDSESVFSTSSVTDIQCCETNINIERNKHLLCSGIYFIVQVGVFLFYEFNPPRIAGETVITEGGRLHLSCDGSNSAPQPTLQWISPDGEVVSESGELDIVNITRNMTGIYTCVATLLYSNTTMNSTVNVFVMAPPIHCTTLSSTETIIVNMSSTVVGSKATYQCKTDVYTTQCTSHGVWEPHPLSILDCTESTKTGSPCATYQVGVIILSLTVVIETGLLVGILVVKILLTKRRSKQKTREERLEMDDNVAYGTHKEVVELRKSRARAM